MRLFLSALIWAAGLGLACAQTMSLTGAGTATSVVLSSNLSAPMLGSAYTNNLGTAAINYALFSNTNTFNATKAQVTAPIAVAGTLSNFVFALNTSPGAGAGWTFSVCDDNTASCALTCDITGAGGTNCSDTTHTLTVSKDDIVYVKSCPYNTATCTAGTAPTASVGRFGFEFTASGGQHAPIAFSTGTNTATASDTCSGLGTNSTTTNPCTPSAPGGLLGETVAPTAGTLNNLDINCSTNPGSVSKSWTVTLYKNGVATALTATVTNTCAVTTGSGGPISVAAGDNLSLFVHPSATAPAGSFVYGSVDWSPTTSGEYPLMTSAAPANWGTSGTDYNPVTGSSMAATATENIRYNVVPVNMTIAKVYATLDTAPGSGASRLFDIKADTTTVTTGCATGNTTGCSGTLSASLTGGATHFVDSRMTFSGTVSALTTWGHLSWVSTIAGGVACTNKLDFSVACNSQYLGTGMAGL